MATEDHEPEFDPDDPGTTSTDTADDAQAKTVAEGPSGETAAEAATGTADDQSADADAGAAATGDGYATESIKRILEAALLVAGRPLSINDFEKLFGGSTEAPPRNAIRGALAELATDWSGRSLALQEVASGWRAQVRTEFEPWIARLWDEKPPRYSRALLETLAIIAYRQPMTRSEIEDIRGVSVSSQIIRTLTEREWIRVVGHREAPGRPAMYGTTREFLDYFNLKTLDQLPPISDIKDLEGQYPELGFEAEPASGATSGATSTGDAPGDSAASPESHDDGPDTKVIAGNGEDGSDDASDTGDATADVDTPYATDDDADEDDAEEPPCTPAS